jgi:hypothetical protein
MAADSRAACFSVRTGGGASDLSCQSAQLLVCCGARGHGQGREQAWQPPAATAAWRWAAGRARFMLRRHVDRTPTAGRWNSSRVSATKSSCSNQWFTASWTRTEPSNTANQLKLDQCSTIEATEHKFIFKTHPRRDYPRESLGLRGWVGSPLLLPACVFCGWAAALSTHGKQPRADPWVRLGAKSLHSVASSHQATHFYIHSLLVCKKLCPNAWIVGE